MAILRLHGCGVGCRFCDTRETWEAYPGNEVTEIAVMLGTNPKWMTLSADDIARFITTNYRQVPYVLVTGGEPAEQPLHELTQTLHACGFKVALETSGTEPFPASGFDWVCVSPKFDNPGGKDVLVYALTVADEIKHVVGKQADIDRLDVALQVVADEGAEIKGQICLQPMSTNQRATLLCIETCLARGWRLSIQTHKLLEVR